MHLGAARAVGGGGRGLLGRARRSFSRDECHVRAPQRLGLGVKRRHEALRKGFPAQFAELLGGRGRRLVPDVCRECAQQLLVPLHVLVVNDDDVRLDAMPRPRAVLVGGVEELEELVLEGNVGAQRARMEEARVTLEAQLLGLAHEVDRHLAARPRQEHLEVATRRLRVPVPRPPPLPCLIAHAKRDKLHHAALRALDVADEGRAEDARHGFLVLMHGAKLLHGRELERGHVLPQPVAAVIVLVMAPPRDLAQHAVHRLEVRIHGPLSRLLLNHLEERWVDLHAPPGRGRRRHVCSR
mmetsp:Transcript_741/g.1842  ORF Transcript_741/g.1842 Transcript_741/m.1842 type:complete len:297 (+) Transcript_741:981-1871(+)